MINRRLISVTAITIFVVFILCMSAYVFTLPKAQQSWIDQTANVISTEAANNTQTQQVVQQFSDNQATQTMVVIQTEQARPIDTPIPSPTVSFSECKGFMKANSPVYFIPGKGWVSSEKINKTDQVIIVAQLDDSGWYVVKSTIAFGWVFGTNLDFDEDCPNIDTISHLLASINQQSFIRFDQNIFIDDTFASNIYGWKDSLGFPYERELDNTGDYLLVVDGYTKKQTINSDNLSAISNPQVAFLLSRSNAEISSYVGILFESVTYPGENFEVRVLGGQCSIQIYKNEAKLAEQKVDVPSNTCNGAENYIELSIVGNQVLARINGEGPYQIALDKDYGLGKLSFIVDRTIVKINFLVVATPK